MDIICREILLVETTSEPKRNMWQRTTTLPLGAATAWSKTVWCMPMQGVRLAAASMNLGDLAFELNFRRCPSLSISQGSAKKTVELASVSEHQCR